MSILTAFPIDIVHSCLSIAISFKFELKLLRIFQFVVNMDFLRMNVVASSEIENLANCFETYVPNDIYSFDLFHNRNQSFKSDMEMMLFVKRTPQYLMCYHFMDPIKTVQLVRNPFSFRIVTHSK